MKTTTKLTATLFTTILSVFIFMGITVFASGTLLTYQGWGIRGKESVQNFTINSDTYVTLTHTNSNFAYNGYGEDVMVITYQKKGFWWSNTEYSVTTRGNGSTTYSTTLPRGTYRLYFNTIYQGATADISGNVIN